MADAKKSKRHKVYGLGDMFCMYYCPECGKDFVVQDTSAYTYKKHDGKNLRYFCSYTCYRAFSKRYEEQKVLNNRRGRYKQIENKRRKEAQANGLEKIPSKNVPEQDTGEVS